jgi:hypothetical protein
MRNQIHIALLFQFENELLIPLPKFFLPILLGSEVSAHNNKS